jgi:hypothetical protein
MIPISKQSGCDRGTNAGLAQSLRSRVQIAGTAAFATGGKRFPKNSQQNFFVHLAAATIVSSWGKPNSEAFTMQPRMEHHHDTG